MNEDSLYTKEKLVKAKEKILNLYAIVSELERMFPGRHFTPDGHLVGSLGEVIAAYHYGITLYKPSKEKHDGYVGKKEVQIKITQRKSIVLSDKPGAPDYLIVLSLDKDGNVFEVYNGPGKKPWKASTEPDSHNNRHLRISKLLELDLRVPVNERIFAINPIEKMKR